MARALVVADEVDHALWSDVGRVGSVDLLLSAGDLPFDYLEFLVDALEVPAVMVPGNHDRELGGYTLHAGLSVRAGFPERWPGPRGWANADTRVVTAAGLRIAGLGGSVRYSGGPNQWTQQQAARRARRLVRRARGPVDVLLTHSPPRGVGDGDDDPHQGFDCLHDVVRRLRPRWLLHGHIHPYGQRVEDHILGTTTVRNVVGSHIIDLEPAEHSAEIS
ncbi:MULTISPECIES: metallophosphoesterase [Thermocrispum]|jgi:hypothetical protein|uniref:Metallophosphoesterase n=1 Tax=Thermocrispum agreste TaxID=37925 RepID=A0A2W4JE32_9PSEU|nr:MULTISPECIES: metallophosphoesterase [Thermocrispum]PZM97522.1 MAG: metallophosphoesterase [Thermocrispum agreste]